MRRRHRAPMLRQRKEGTVIEDQVGAVVGVVVPTLEVRKEDRRARIDRVAPAVDDARRREKRARSASALEIAQRLVGDAQRAWSLRRSRARDPGGNREGVAAASMIFAWRSSRRPGAPSRTTTGRPRPPPDAMTCSTGVVPERGIPRMSSGEPSPWWRGRATARAVLFLSSGPTDKAVEFLE